MRISNRFGRMFPFLVKSDTAPENAPFPSLRGEEPGLGGHPRRSDQARFLRNVLFKTAVLFILFNVLYVLIQPLPLLDHLSLYNTVFPGRERFPWSDDPIPSYNTSVARLGLLFSTHRLAGTRKRPQEYRVLVLGDSSIWGLEVPAGGTAPACLDRLGVTLPDGRVIKAYNLAYPAPNVLRDVLIMQEALNYQPDLIVWFLTLQSLKRDELALSDIVIAQRDDAIALAKQAGFTLQLTSPMDRTFWGQRSALAKWLQIQLQAFGWSASGIDYAPLTFRRPPEFDLTDSQSYDMSDQAVAWDMLVTGMSVAEKQRKPVPVMLVNEPLFISTGINSDVRYNANYPRVAYDQYRAQMTALTDQHHWPYLDLWNAVPASEFIRTSLHYSPEAACLVARQVADRIVQLQAAH